MIGLDMVEVARLARCAKSEHFLKRVFSKSELEYYAEKGRSAETLAGMWCVKEAVGKALGTGLIFPLASVETVHISGAPKAVLHGKAKELAAGRKAEISVTHTGGFAAAVAVIL